MFQSRIASVCAFTAITNIRVKFVPPEEPLSVGRLGTDSLSC